MSGGGDLEGVSGGLVGFDDIMMVGSSQIQKMEPKILGDSEIGEGMVQESTDTTTTIKTTNGP